jgi:hypothetical protein
MSTRPLAAQMLASPQLNVVDESNTAGVEVRTRTVLGVEGP